MFETPNWDYRTLSSNPNITWEFVKTNFDKKWYYPELLKNPGITWDDIKNNPEIDIRYYSYFSYNPNVTWEIMKQYQEINWDYRAFLCCNPDLNYDFIIKNKNELNDNMKKIYGSKDLFYVISINTFENAIKTKATKTIQDTIIKWIYQPTIKDGKLGINARLTIKMFYNLKETPMYLSEIQYH